MSSTIVKLHLCRGEFIIMTADNCHIYDPAPGRRLSAKALLSCRKQGDAQRSTPEQSIARAPPPHLRFLFVGKERAALLRLVFLVQDLAIVHADLGPAISMHVVDRHKAAGHGVPVGRVVN